MDLYFDLSSGISGDMTLGALVDLGVPIDWLREQLSTMPLTGFDIKQSRVTRNGMAAQKIDVIVDSKAHPKNYADIKALLENSPYDDGVKQVALTAFGKLAAAEAAIHGCPKEKVHFHEVGGIDAIVDITGTALGLNYLGVKKIAASPPALGSGTVQCQHGTLPVPAPATVALLKGVPVYGTDLGVELVTPTGAAIITTLADWFGPLPAMTLAETGYGAGSREIKTLANVLRIISGTFTGAAETGANAGEDENIMIVEACIDDMNPEIFGYVMERLFADGALDVCWIPVFMKKNRPGTMMQVLCRPQDQTAITNLILSETTSAGVRHYLAQRTTLARQPVVIDTALGRIAGKQMTLPDGRTRVTPEYEACRVLAGKNNIPINDLYQAAIAAALNPAAVSADKDNK